MLRPAMPVRGLLVALLLLGAVIAVAALWREDEATAPTPRLGARLLERLGPGWETWAEPGPDGMRRVAADLGFAREAPLGAERWRLTLEIDFLDPGEDGTGSAEEAADLEALASEARAVFEQTLGAIPVGHERERGRIRHVWYAARRQAFEEHARAAMATRPDHAFRTEVELDAPWRVYLERLLPSPASARWILDRRLFERLPTHIASEGRAHVLTHGARFRTEAGRAAFLEEVRARGFRAVELAEESEDPRWSVAFERSDALVLPAIHAVTLDLAERATARGGEYEGWEVAGG
jgi:hypothetical protein